MPAETKSRERQMTLWESDGRIVPLLPDSQSGESKPGNAGAGKAAGPILDPDDPSTALSGGDSVLDRLDRIAERAETHPEEVFNNLYSVINRELLFYAFRRLKTDAAPGVDGVTVEQYEDNLWENLTDLAARLQRRGYRPQPSVRREIPKGNGKTRPLGLACVEDKIVQRAVVMILERIYECDFEDTSFGFRPGRSQHDALRALGNNIHRGKCGWISDADIRGFFDHVDFEHLRAFLSIRIKDPGLLRLIERFLHAGVLIQGRLDDTTEGVPQGSVLSPLLANVYLHYVLDRWFERDVRPRMRGESRLVRFADDFICTFQYESDARRFQAVLPKRLARFCLELAGEKTQLLRFGRFARRDCQRLGKGSPGTFDFLGFTHYCGQSRQGHFKLKRKTATKKFRAKLRELKKWFRENLTTPAAVVWKTLNAKLSGHYQYYGINDNWPWLLKYRESARRLARRWMSRRSQKGFVSWDSFHAYEALHPLIQPRRLVDLIAAKPQQ